MMQTDEHLISEIGQRADFGWIIVFAVLLRFIEHDPIVVVIFMWIQCDLLFCGCRCICSAFQEMLKSREAQLTLAASRIVVRVRMKVSTLRMQVSDCNTRAERNVCETSHDQGYELKILS